MAGLSLQNWKLTGAPIQLLWGESQLTVTPALHDLTQLLTIDVKVMQQHPKKPWIRKTVTHRKPMYTLLDLPEKIELQIPVEPDPGMLPGMQGMARTRKVKIYAMWTHHGFIDDVCKALREWGIPYNIVDARLQGFPFPRLDQMFGFRFNQRELLVSALAQNRSGLIGAPTRYGKCFGKGTPVLMFDGSIRAVETITEGELVMGHDSEPRRVTGCVRGFGKMFRVTPNYGGMTWTCNEDHILHVQRVRESADEKWNRSGERENITVREWMSSTKWFKHVRKMRRAPVKYPTAVQDVPAYIYGAWLGDGHSSGITFTNGEPEVWREIEAWAVKEGLTESGCSTPAGKAITRSWVLNLGTGGTKPGTNVIRGWLRKHAKSAGIRPEYLVADEQQRWELLAGLLDTDGESNSTSCCGIVTKHKLLAHDIVRLCNSLGLGAVSRPCTKKSQNGTVGQYWRVGIRGPSDKIPFRVPRKRRERENKFNCLTVGFKVEQIEDGEYYGFELEGADRLFLLGDNTVVHNTTLLINTIRAYAGLRMLVIAPGKDLIKQLYLDIKEKVPHLEVKMVHGGTSNKKPCKHVTVLSADSMDKIDPAYPQLILIDEPHALPTEGRMPDFVRFDKARKIGFGATLDGRFDNKDMMIKGLIGPVLAERTYREAVVEGAIAPIVMLMLEVRLRGFACKNRDAAYKEAFWLNENMAQLVGWILNILPQDWQVLGFIKNEEQAEFLSERLTAWGIYHEVAMAKNMTPDERDKRTNDFKDGTLLRCLATDIFAQGVTFSKLRVMMNLGGGGASTSTIQKPGRVAEMIDGKRCGVGIDILFTFHDEDYIDFKGSDCFCLARESQARMDYYVERGFEVYRLKTFDALVQKLKERCV